MHQPARSSGTSATSAGTCTSSARPRNCGSSCAGPATELTQQLSRAPKDDELAEHLGISDDDLRDAQRADLAFHASSLDAPRSAGPDPGSLADLLGEDDPQLEHTLDMESVWAHWGELPEREQRLLMMRFYGNMTQAEIGERLGISQMHVSRLLAGALGYLRGRVLGQEPGDEPAADQPLWPDRGRADDRGKDRP